MSKTDDTTTTGQYCPTCGTASTERTIGADGTPWYYCDCGETWKPERGTDATTRAEHHADSTRETVRYSRRVVHRALEAGHVGRDDAIHGSELEAFVPVAETTVRDVIAELRDDPDGPPIGSCSEGYFVIETADELADWLETKYSEIETAKQRIEANTKAFNRRRYE